MIRALPLVGALAPWLAAPARADDHRPHNAALCRPGQKITPASHGHCCWPGQAWQRGGCVGLPSSCPPGMEIEGRECLRRVDFGEKKRDETCAPGEVATEATRGHCCWPGQTWGHEETRGRAFSFGMCVGTPTCGPGFHRAGETCVRDVVREARREVSLPRNAFAASSLPGPKRTTDEMLTGVNKVEAPLPDKPADAAVAQVMVALRPRFAECYARFKVPANATLSLVIAGSGRIESAAAIGSLFNTPEGMCVAAAARAVSFPPFRSRVLALTYPVILP